MQEDECREVKESWKEEFGVYQKELQKTSFPKSWLNIQLNVTVYLSKQ